MKKFSKLMLACILTFGIAACADDDNSSSNQPSYDDPTIKYSHHTAKIGEPAEKTITFTNPYNSSTNLDVYFNHNNNSKITIDKVKSTCKFKTDGGIPSNDISHILQADESCTLIYNFAPTNLDTELLKLNVDYRADIKTICPTPDTVPTYEQVSNSNKYEEWYIYNYAEDSNGNKSPEFINVEIPAEYSVSSNIANLNLVSYEKDFNLPAKKGEYSFYNLHGASLKSNDENCSILNNTLTVNGNNACSLTVTATAKYVSPIKFTPKQEGNPYYNVNINIKSNYTYDLLSAPYSTTFYPEYIKANLSGDTYIDASLLSNNEKITSYEITGTNKDKFKVAPTKHNGCTVTDTEISIPEGQQNCFYTIEITDISKTADYTAVLNTTLSTGATQTYNINGEVSLLTIEDLLSIYCKQSSQNKENNKQYKLF